jgi:hypothetical protein
LLVLPKINQTTLFGSILITPIIIKFLLVFSAQFLEVGVLPSPIFLAVHLVFLSSGSFIRGAAALVPNFFFAVGFCFF